MNFPFLASKQAPKEGYPNGNKDKVGALFFQNQNNNVEDYFFNVMGGHIIYLFIYVFIYSNIAS
jgi:hypothetical protein